MNTDISTHLNAVKITQNDENHHQKNSFDTLNDIDDCSTILTQLPSSTILVNSNKLQKSSSITQITETHQKKDVLSTSTTGNVSKRALSLLGNIKTNPTTSKKLDKSQISLHRSQSLPNEAMLSSHALTDEPSLASTVVSESDFDQMKSKASTSVTGFKKFQQIVQTANQNTKKKSGGEFQSNRRLYNESSNSSAPDVDGPQSIAPSTYVSYQSEPPLLLQSTPQSSQNVPLSLFSVCTRQVSERPTQATPVNQPSNNDALKNAQKSPNTSSDYSRSLVEVVSPIRQTLHVNSKNHEPTASESSPRRSLESERVLNEDIAPESSEPTINNPQLSEPNDYVLPSLCFALEERMASCTTTLCGSYILASFTNGTIRLYELLKSGNTDLEDRFGYILGFMSSSSNHSSLRIHTQCCGGVLHTSSPAYTSSSSSSRTSVVLYPSHIFIGARQGSTEFYVVDTLSVTKSRKKRGFLTMVDSQIQIYKKSDTRLRGFCSAIPIDISSVPCQLSHSNAECLLNYDQNDVGYQCKYHVLCGAAYMRYTIWEVILTASPSCVCLNGDPSHHDIIFTYTEQWNVIFQGSSNGPSLVNAFLFSHYPGGDWPLRLPFSSRTPASSTDRESVIELISQGLNKDARITQVSTSSNPILQDVEIGTHLQILEDSLDDSLSSFHEFVKPQTSLNGKNFPALSQTVTPFRGVCNIHATSSDGMILFTGLDELVIYRLHHTSVSEGTHNLKAIEIYEKMTFSLNDFVDPNQLLKRKSRHFRQIEEIECTPDGQYALIRCSDVTVLLYSLVDLFGCGMGPFRTEVRAQSPLPPSAPLPHPSGFLTLCYQIPETYSLRISLSYVENDRSLTNQRDLESWETKYPHLVHPSKVLVLTSWIPIIATNGMDTSGVLRADRLCLLSTISQSTSDKFNFRPGFVPSLISITDVGLDFGTKKKQGCRLCGCFDVNHWPDLIIDLTKPQTYSSKRSCESESDIPREDLDEFNVSSSRKPLKRRSEPVKSTSDLSTTTGKRRRKSLFDDEVDLLDSAPTTEETVESQPVRVNSNQLNRSLLTPSRSSGNPSNRQLLVMEEEILTLKSLLHEKEKECSTLIRKFDARFKIEFNTRRNWRAQMSQLETKLSNQQKKAMEFEARAVEAERMVGLYQGVLGPVVDLYQSLESRAISQRHTAEHDVIIQPSWRNNGSRISIMSAPRVPTTTVTSHLTTSTYSTPPSDDNFCVVCQTYTADTRIDPCGHICLCYSHAVSMQTERILRVCPLCKQECHGISRVSR